MGWPDGSMLVQIGGDAVRRDSNLVSLLGWSLCGYVSDGGSTSASCKCVTWS